MCYQPIQLSLKSSLFTYSLSLKKFIFMNKIWKVDDDDDDDVKTLQLFKI